MTCQGSSATLFVIDDDADYREALCELLEWAGFRVLPVSNGRDAVALFSASPERPCLVLLDVRMPHMDGIQLYRWLREHGPPSVRDVDVVFVTAAEDKVRALGVPFFAKPVDPEKIIGLAKTYCRGGAAA